MRPIKCLLLKNKYVILFHCRFIISSAKSDTCYSQAFRMSLLKATRVCHLNSPSRWCTWCPTADSAASANCQNLYYYLALSHRLRRRGRKLSAVLGVSNIFRHFWTSPRRTQTESHGSCWSKILCRCCSLGIQICLSRLLCWSIGAVLCS